MKITAQDTFSLDEIEALKAKAGSRSAQSRISSGQRAFEAEKESFYKFLDNLPFFAYLQEKDYSIRFANRVFRETTERAPERTAIRSWGRETPCESCPALRVFETGEPASGSPYTRRTGLSGL
jgi:hypothetical protein